MGCESAREYDGWWWGMADRKMEVLLVVGGFDVDGDAEARLVNKDVNVQEGDMGRGGGPSKSDRVASILRHSRKRKS